MSKSSVCSILDLPDEILVKIILHFDPIERLALGNSCQRFNNLVFGDAKLLRNLDFTRERPCSKDIQQYFNDESTYKKILGINVKNVWAVRNLSSLIMKAINLVELNILRAFNFNSVKELSCFLKPLVHLKRLAVGWPDPDPDVQPNYENCNQVLEEPFSRLTYLSLKIKYCPYKCLLILPPCQQLEELRMSISGQASDYASSLPPKSLKLSNLKFVRLTGSPDLVQLGRYIMRIVSDPAEWTAFYLTEPYDVIYLERNAEVCAELSQVRKMPLPPSVAQYCRTSPISEEGWLLVFENLLSKVIRITHEDAPQKFCCLTGSTYSSRQPCLLKIDEAKKLLKDPQYQISYLEFLHDIEKDCDVHLLASAFPDLTKLVLAGILSNTNSMLVPKSTKPLHRRLRKKGSPASEEHSDARNKDSSFKMLVENTPRLKVLVISSNIWWENMAKNWNLDALDLISGWKNLTVIHLCGIPITDGKFLIDIGRECKNLHEVTLHHLCADKYRSYDSQLLEMLQHCKNLRKLSIQGMILEHLSEMLNILSNCSRLAALSLGTITKESDFLELKSSVNKMVPQCQELKRFTIDIEPDHFRRWLRFTVKM